MLLKTSGDRACVLFVGLEIWFVTRIKIHEHRKDFLGICDHLTQSNDTTATDGRVYAIPIFQTGHYITLTCNNEKRINKSCKLFDLSKASVASLLSSWLVTCWFHWTRSIERKQSTFLSSSNPYKFSMSPPPVADVAFALRAGAPPTPPGFTVLLFPPRVVIYSNEELVISTMS